MRNFLGLMLAFAAVAALPTGAQAQATLGPAIAYHDDYDVGVGAALNVPIREFGSGVAIMADFYYFFPPENVDYLELNGNLLYAFGDVDRDFAPYIFGGINVGNVSVDLDQLGAEDEGETDVGLNLGAGLDLALGGVRPNVGIKIEVGGGEGLVLFAHVPFVIGDG